MNTFSPNRRKNEQEVHGQQCSPVYHFITFDHSIYYFLILFKHRNRFFLNRYSNTSFRSAYYTWDFMVLKYWILHHPGIKVQVNLNLTKSKHMHSNIANGINGFFEEKDFPNIYSCVELCTTLRVPLLQWDLTVKKLISKVQEAFL